jgi:hypothetical protein
MEESMNLAAHGDDKAAREFFLAFLAGPLYVPERFQSESPLNAPEYPNDFMNVMGIRDRDRVVVPVFSNPVLIEAWCGKALTYRTLPTIELLDLMPEDWWLIVNPGCEIDKDISPWEVEQLREGVQGIPAIIEELFPTGLETVIEVETPRDDEYPELKNKLREFGAARAGVEALYLLIENGIDIDDNPTVAMLIGAKATLKDSDDMNRLRDEIRSVVDVAMIGHTERVKVLIGGDAEDNMVLGIFKQVTPFYEKPQPSMLKRFMKAFTSS